MDQPFENPADTGTDRNVCVTIKRRNLPHWTKDKAIYWITFRLADSIPVQKLRAWKAERDLWLTHNPEPWSEADWKKYDEHFGDRLERWLDAGHGSCTLAREEVRQVVQECLLRFDGERLWLHAAVIMPNHVHLLLEPLSGHKLSGLLKGIKGASSSLARQILPNHSSSSFWMEESYDHIVRSQAQYDHFVRYIESNPVKAGLTDDKFWLYQGRTGIPACSFSDSVHQPVIEQ